MFRFIADRAEVLLPFMPAFPPRGLYLDLLHNGNTPNPFRGVLMAPNNLLGITDPVKLSPEEERISKRAALSPYRAMSPRIP